MKRILITGENSYVGNSVEQWLNNFSGYRIDKLSVRDNSWKEFDFSSYDVILHVAGIAHRKETNENRELYYKVNRDLTYELSKKAKKEGVPHFLFLSSMSVYGVETGVIKKDTIPKPKTNYGKSKLEAEKLLNNLRDKHFRVTIVRPPMIYGKNCIGNYKSLSSLAMKTPIFPNIQNKRSMIYIDNLSELIRLLIDNKREGLYLPQNKEYVTTSKMVESIAREHGKNIRLVRLFNPFIKMLNVSIINKVFGDLTYDKNISIYDENYNVVDFNKSIYLTESGE